MMISLLKSTSSSTISKSIRLLSSIDKIYIRNTLNNNNLSLLNQSKSSILTWYSCGPTVYDDAHLGHARTYVCTDIIRRILTDYFGYTINFAMGLTDVDDKIIKKAMLTNNNTYNNTTICTNDDISKISRKYESDFFTDLDRLNVKRPDAILRVTEHMDEIIAYISGIIDRGYGYTTNDGVYFNVTKCKDYGKLGNIPTNHDDDDNNESQHQKKSKRDFALWKISKNNEPSWDSPWGKGRPGWHIECSAVTHSYFGSHLDIHSGGVDLRFPHHTNEIAQCEAHNNCHDWVKYWIHTGHLFIDGYKMSKSLKNFISIRDYFNTSTNNNKASLNFRIFCLQYKYHSAIHLSDDRLEEANMFRIKIESFYKVIDTLASSSSSDKSLRSNKPTIESIKLLSSLSLCKSSIRKALQNDFDTPDALKSLSSLIGEGQQYALKYEKNDNNQPIEPLISIKDYLNTIVTVFGLQFNNNNDSNYDNEIDPNAYIETFVRFRSSIRKISLQSLKKYKKTKNSTDDSNNNAENIDMTKNILGECDRVRDAVSKMGILIEDHSDNSIWSKK